MTRFVRIYRPDKNAMQAGMAKTHQWLLEFEADSPLFIDGLMGWTGSRDTARQLELRFPTREAAIAYAEKKGLKYEVFEPHAREQQKKSYSDNFRFDKIQ